MPVSVNVSRCTQRPTSTAIRIAPIPADRRSSRRGMVIQLVGSEAEAGMFNVATG